MQTAECWSFIYWFGKIVFVYKKGNTLWLPPLKDFFINMVFQSIVSCYFKHSSLGGIAECRSRRTA